MSQLVIGAREAPTRNQWRFHILNGIAKALPPFAFIVSLLGAWEVLVRTLKVSPLVLPPPSAIAAKAVSEAGFFVPHFLVTGGEVVAGFLAATVIGCILGFVIAFSRRIGSAVYPVIIGAQVTPKVAIAPLLVIWFGFGVMPKIILTAIISFFPVVVSMIVGLNATRREQIYLFRSMDASRTTTFFKLLLPGALPVLFGGLKVAATLSVIGAVVGEFASATKGLGYVLMFSVGTLDTTSALAATAYLIVLGLMVFFSVILVEQAVVPAHMRRRLEESGEKM